MSEKCQIHIDLNPEFDTVCLCDRPAKFISPADAINPRQYVCGIHRRAADAMWRRQGMETRCVPIRQS